MEANKLFYVVGYASNIAGAEGCAELGPSVIKNSTYLASIKDILFSWQAIIAPNENIKNINENVAHMCTTLAEYIADNVRKKFPSCVIGGDHTSAIGTWSGVYDAVHEKGDFGLIWIDAHMDSHTPQSSESGHIHGMPLACLLGAGLPSLTQIMHATAKVKPENLCLIGIRSYESGEADFLKQLGVKIYFMDEIKSRGFATIFKEAFELVNRNTIGYGISLDIDAIDPSEAPAVDVPEPDGIFMQDLLQGLEGLDISRLLATEIVEFDPTKDIQRITENNIIKLLEKIARKTLA